MITELSEENVDTNTDLWDKDFPHPWKIGGIPPETVKLLVTCSPIRTLVTDSQGRQAGLDPDTGEIITDIPGAIVTKDGDDPHIIMIPNAQEQYQVQTMGVDTGHYTIAMADIISGTTQMTMRRFTGTTTIGESRQFNFDSAVYQEANGQVTLETEHNNWQIGEVDQAWLTQTTQAGYIGPAYITSQHDLDQLYTTEIFTTTSPVLEYNINFTTTGTYNVWLRGYAPNATSDSLYVSLGGQTWATLTGWSPQQWGWTDQTMTGQRVTFEVTEAGEQTLYLWMREDGLKIDRIVLTVDDTYNPQGEGPPESPRLGDN